MKLEKQIANWIKGQVKKAKAKGIVVGLSGGVDSALCAALCKEALGKKLLGLIMPCHSDPADTADALIFSKKFNIRTKKIDLTKTYDSLTRLYPSGGKTALANIKPRLRMITLYYFANSLNYLVCGTGNKSEAMMGYFTKYGDGGADILPLGDILKTEVRQLARNMVLPKKIIDKAPSAGLWKGQTDEGEMKITYDNLDALLSKLSPYQGGGRLKVRRGVVASKLKKGLKIKSNLVKRKIKQSQHKLSLPPVFRKS
ncbi:MAG: NAD(+) synthase [bacterium]